MQQSFSRQNSSGNGNVGQQQGTGGRWDAILAERKSSNHNSGNSNNYHRQGSGFSNNYNNSRNPRENSDSRYNNRRDQDSHRAFHSHVGGQSSDATGTDWNTPLPANVNLER